MEAEKQTNARVFDELSAHDSRIGQELLQQKVPDMINVADKYSYLVCVDVLIVLERDRKYFCLYAGQRGN